MPPTGRSGPVSTSDADNASSEAGRGALVGAAKWGFFTAALGAIAYAFSPVYRGLTVQFKVFIQMSGMTLGGMVEADRRLRTYELWMRRERKMIRDREAWTRYEQGFEEEIEARRRAGKNA